MSAFLALVSAVLFLITASSSVRAVVPIPPGSVPSFASLTSQQRTQLPDDTKVSVGKYIVTLGVLRAQHRSRTMHITTAATAGSAASLAVNGSKALHLSVRPAVFSSNVLGNPVIEPAASYSQTALDMQKFCNAAQATVCLYYPASTTLQSYNGMALDLDPYITDASVCASQGGSEGSFGWGSEFCQFNYNTWYNAQFNPGSGFTYKATCDPTYWTITKVDQHGAILVNSAIPANTLFTTGGNPSSCVIRAWVTP
jgi:hypothetical protein